MITIGRLSAAIVTIARNKPVKFLDCNFPLPLKTTGTEPMMFERYISKGLARGKAS
jgi:hypothetical protein